MDIKKYIPKGHENAVTIETLMAMTGMSNRMVRLAIAESDAIILNMQDGKGYFRMNPRTKAERAFAEKYSAQEKRSTALSSIPAVRWNIRHTFP